MSCIKAAIDCTKGSAKKANPKVWLDCAKDIITACIQSGGGGGPAPENSISSLQLRALRSQNGEQKCAFVRVQTFKFPKRQDMENLRDAWIAELGSVPPGNATDRAMWASTVGEVADVMSEVERKAYEEKKLKLHQAMADTNFSKESETIDASDALRRRQLEAAVENDNWSTMIAQQTQETKS